MLSKFITIEGIEGVGKSTAVAYLKEWLEEHKLLHIVTREPGGTPLAEKIRNLLIENTDEKVATKTELLLFFAGRAQHIDQVILPNLAQGKVVLCDRFTDATYAYQGVGRGVEEKEIAVLEEWVQNDLRPDATILLDAPVDVAFARMQKRGALDRIENEKKTFFERVRFAYLDRAKRYSTRYHVVDATQSLVNVTKQLAAIMEMLCRTQER